MIVDAHVHVASGDTDRYPRSPTGLGSDWWEHGGGVDELTSTFDANDVERAVVVQAMGVYRADNRCAADVVAAHPDRFALVVGIDLDDSDPAAAVVEHAAAGARGVRLWAMGSAEPTWLTDGRGTAVWEAAAACSVVVVPMTSRHELHALGDLCAQTPTALVAIDHGGRARHRGVDDLLRLAAIPSVHVKVTTINLEPPGSDAWLAGVVEAYGSERLAWGSDYPQHPTRPYAAMRRIADAACIGAGLDDAQRADYFGGTALRLWWS